MVADVDGDEDVDIVGTFSWDHSIIWYEPSSSYSVAGSLESSILDMGVAVSDWGTIDWVATEPAGTLVSVEVRASDDHASMGSWVAIDSSGVDLSGFLATGAEYFQYRVTLVSAVGTVTPELEDIQVSWDAPSGIAESGVPRGSLMLLGAAPNPSPTGSTWIRFALPRSSDVELQLYDVRGRVVRAVARGVFGAGEHEVPVEGLTSGVYFYELRTAGWQRSGKLVVR
jgi:hypothetical protein